MIVETHPRCEVPICSAYRFRARGIRHQPPPQAGTLDRTEKSATLGCSTPWRSLLRAHEFFAVGIFYPALFEVLSRVAAIDCSAPVLWAYPTIGWPKFKGSTSQSKIETAAIGINTGVAATFLPLPHTKSHFFLCNLEHILSKLCLKFYRSRCNIP